MKSKKELHDKEIFVRMRGLEKKRAEAIAQYQEISVSCLIRLAIAEYCHQWEMKKG
jgi:hypothetical protein